MSLEGLETKLVKYPKGSFIFKKNDFSRDLYVVNSGKIRVFKQVGVRTITLTELEKGAVFGEVAAIDGGPRSATVQALDDTEVFVVTPQEFTKKTTTMPEWFMKIARILVQRLRETDKRIEADGASDSEYNVALLLSYLVASAGRDEEEGGKSIDYKKVEGELADLLHIQYSALSNILEALKQKSLVETRQNLLVVPSLEALEKHARKMQDEVSKGFYV